jgi:hypothetical protein
MQECRNVGMKECRNAGMQECRVQDKIFYSRPATGITFA